MSRSGKSCSHCGKPAATKRAIFCERCGSQEFIVTDETNINKSKTDKPTRKELESQLESLRADKKELENSLQEKIVELNEKSRKCLELEKIIAKLEYSQYLLEEEFKCQKRDFEEESLEDFNRCSRNFISEYNDEEEEGGNSRMMRPEKEKFWGFKKGREIPLWKKIMAIVLNSLRLIVIIGLSIYGWNMLSVVGSTPTTPSATIAPTLNLTPLPTVKPSVAPTLKPTVSPTPSPTPVPTPTPKINQTEQKRLETTEENISLIFNKGDTVVSWGCIELINGEKYSGRYVLYNSHFQGIVTHGIINPHQWEITNETVINP